MTSSFWDRLLGSRAPAATVRIRVATGVVFLSEGIQKFLYPDALGAGRFAKIGIPTPELITPFVGVVEAVGGALLLGLLTRLAAAALIIDCRPGAENAGRALREIFSTPTTTE